MLVDVVVCPGEVLSVLDVDVLEGLDVLVEAASLQLNSLHVCISDYKKINTIGMSCVLLNKQRA